MSLLDDLRQSIINGDMNAAQSFVRQALAEQLPAGLILQDGLISAMQQVGRLFENNEFYVPEMLVSARAMKAGLALLRPHLIADEVKPLGKIVIGTVHGDYHDIGKNLVGMMLEGSGFEVIDLGVDISAEKFVAAVKMHQPNLVGCSALITTTMAQMEIVINALRSAGLRDQVKVMVGGAPINEEFARRIGADGFAADAAMAAVRAKELMREMTC